MLLPPSLEPFFDMVARYEFAVERYPSERALEQLEDAREGHFRLVAIVSCGPDPFGLDQSGG